MRLAAKSPFSFGTPGDSAIAGQWIAADGLFRDFGDRETLAEGLPYERPETLTLEQIDRIIGDFSVAAQRAVAAGFDAIELHGANGYLIHTFFNSSSNRRDDEFGGDVAGRSEFAVRLIRRT